MGPLVRMAGTPSTTTTPPPAPPLHPAPTPAGMAMWAQVQKALAKKAAKVKRAGAVATKGPVSQPNSPEGTGGPNDPVWQHLASLYKDGLPG